MGIDLAAYERRFSGICVIRGKNAFTIRLRTDDEIITMAKKARPSVIAIDAPLTSNPAMRKCDIDLIKLGFRVFPPGFSHMRDLSLRGFSLAKKLDEFDVIETFPSAAYKIMGIRKPRRKSEIKGAAEILERKAGVMLEKVPESIDELDSFVCAIVAMEKGRGRAVAYGNSSGIIYLPLFSKQMPSESPL